MKKIICIVMITIISLLQLGVVFADPINILQFSEIENQVLSRNLDVQQDHSDSNNAEINSSITSLQNMRDDMSIAMHKMVDKSLGVGSSALDAPAKDYLSDVYARMITLYSATLGTLEGQINSLRAQLSNNVYSPSRVIAKNSIVWSAQQLYLMYSSLEMQQEELLNKSEQIENKKKVASLQKELGMISDIDYQELIEQASDIKASVKALNDNMVGVKGQLNLLLGQNFDIPLSLGGIPPVDSNTISDFNYGKDYETALKESLEVKILGSEKTYKKDKEIMKLKLTFDKKYNDVFNKKSVLDNEAAKFERENKKLDVAKLKFDAGLISRMEYENQAYSLKAQSIKFKTVQQDLFKSYIAYKWLLRGYDAPSN